MSQPGGKCENWNLRHEPTRRQIIVQLAQRTIKYPRGHRNHRFLHWQWLPGVQEIRRWWNHHRSNHEVGNQDWRHRVLNRVERSSQAHFQVHQRHLLHLQRREQAEDGHSDHEPQCASHWLNGQSADLPVQAEYWGEFNRILPSIFRAPQRCLPVHYQLGLQHVGHCWPPWQIHNYLENQKLWPRAEAKE